MVNTVTSQQECTKFSFLSESLCLPPTIQRQAEVAGECVVVCLCVGPVMNWSFGWTENG